MAHGGPGSGGGYDDSGHHTMSNGKKMSGKNHGEHVSFIDAIKRRKKKKKKSSSDD